MGFIQKNEGLIILIKISKIIRYYLFWFLLIDAISGYTRIYLGITNPLFNIGYWIRGPILALFIVYYLNRLKKGTIFFDELIAVVLFFYFIINMLINFQIGQSNRFIYENFPYILRLQFLIFFFVYIKNRSTELFDHKEKIIFYNFIVFSLSIIIGYLFGFGLESYRFEGTSKGMFQGGNSASVLNLIFFSFFILNYKLRKSITAVSICFFNGFIIASKSVFGFIIPILFLITRNFTNKNKLLFIIPLFLTIIILRAPITDIINNSYQKRFGINIEKSMKAAEKVGGLSKNQTLNLATSLTFRRSASLINQMEKTFSDKFVFIIGTSFTGQNIFWENRGEFWFKNASMDLFDFFFKFGIIGIFLLLIIILNNFRLYKPKNLSNSITLYLFILYAFFGGHVIDSVTAGSLFYYFLAENNQKLSPIINEN